MLAANDLWYVLLLSELLEEIRTPITTHRHAYLRLN